MPHRPVYRMHRYFARRPYSVFAELIRHYSNPLDIVLDPFCGGGVTLVEGILQARRVIGLDLNPLATFITSMELESIDLNQLIAAYTRIESKYSSYNNKLFRTTCRKCGEIAIAEWFQYSAVTQCNYCSLSFSISSAIKAGDGRWKCPRCDKEKEFSPTSDTEYEIIDVYYKCKACGNEEIAKPTNEDVELYKRQKSELEKEEAAGLWVPNILIPDCNMQRESALFKKRIFQFRQFFTDRHLLALGYLRKMILEENAVAQRWLLFAFSSMLRYTNRMVTSNPSWRGKRPLEWAKPGYWLPPVHLEANVLVEFSRRFDAVIRGKRDYFGKLADSPPPLRLNKATGILECSKSSFYVGTDSATKIPLPDKCVDVIITDPPYGSYVHYADLCNFWSIWLPEIEGLGSLINTAEEAVIARKKFPGAKTANEYKDILERSFLECARVLKDDGYMVLTFHNREPRAWAALLVAANKAGFSLPHDGVLFQDGISSYKHTAQSRRSGSVIGDFILSLKKGPSLDIQLLEQPKEEKNGKITEDEFIESISRILKTYGPTTPDNLISKLYIELIPHLFSQVKKAVNRGNGEAESLIHDFDSIQLLDSHRRQLLENHFSYDGDKWSLKAASE